jgi:hypothetical protein
MTRFFLHDVKRKLNVSTSNSNCLLSRRAETLSDSTRAICIEPTLFDELILVMKFRVLQPPGPRHYALGITGAKCELALCGIKIKRPLLPNYVTQTKLPVFNGRAF